MVQQVVTYSILNFTFWNHQKNKLKMYSHKKTRRLTSKMPKLKTRSKLITGCNFKEEKLLSRLFNFTISATYIYGNTNEICKIYN